MILLSFGLKFAGIGTIFGASDRLSVIDSPLLGIPPPSKHGTCALLPRASALPGLCPIQSSASRLQFLDDALSFRGSLLFDKLHARG